MALYLPVLTKDDPRPPGAILALQAMSILLLHLHTLGDEALRAIVASAHAGPQAGHLAESLKSSMRLAARRLWKTTSLKVLPEPNLFYNLPSSIFIIQPNLLGSVISIYFSGSTTPSQSASIFHYSIITYIQKNFELSHHRTVTFVYSDLCVIIRVLSRFRHA